MECREREKLSKVTREEGREQEMEKERGEEEEDREKEEKKKTGKKRRRRRQGERREGGKEREREKVGSVSIAGTNARAILQAKPPDSPPCTPQPKVHGAEDGKLSPHSHPSHHDGEWFLPLRRGGC